jgi:hypothetical protein
LFEHRGARGLILWGRDFWKVRLGISSMG